DDIQRNRQRRRAFGQLRGVAEQQHEVEQVSRLKRAGAAKLSGQVFRQLQVNEIVGSVQLEAERRAHQAERQRKRGALGDDGGVIFDRRLVGLRRFGRRVVRRGGGLIGR